jgi:hypothetical protein
MENGEMSLGLSGNPTEIVFRQDKSNGFDFDFRSEKVKRQKKGRGSNLLELETNENISEDSIGTK